MAGRPRRSCPNPFKSSRRKRTNKTSSSRSSRPKVLTDVVNVTKRKEVKRYNKAEDVLSAIVDNDEGDMNTETEEEEEEREEKVEKVMMKKGYLCLNSDNGDPSISEHNGQVLEERMEVEQEMESEAELEVESEAELEVESEAELEVESEAELEVESEAELEVESEAELEVESEAELEVESEVELEVEMESDAEQEVKSNQDVVDVLNNRRHCTLSKGSLCWIDDEGEIGNGREIDDEGEIGNGGEIDDEGEIGNGRGVVDEGRRVTEDVLYTGHQNEIERIKSLMGKASDWVPPSLFIYGEEGVGKTLIIKHLLSKMKVPHGYVTMKECYSSRVLYETILNTLSGVLPSLANNYKGYTRCDNLSQFIKDIRSIVNINEWEGQSIYIVLDDFDKIIKMDSSLVTVLVRLAELTNLNLCVVMLSRMAWDTFMVPVPTLQICFKQYNEREVLTILSSNCPVDYSKSFYKTFLKHIWNILHDITRNINDMRYMCSYLFPIYCQPLLSGKVTENDNLQLWYHLRPHCQKYLSQIYTKSSFSMNTQSSHQQQNTPLNYKIPHYAKYLLIASYLASYNPTKCDQQFFAKKRSKKSRRKGTRRAKSKEIKRQFLGPRPFTLDRMLMIVRSITEEVKMATPLLSQIPTLVSLGLLAKVSSVDALDVIKYKCLMSFETIRHISRSVDFEIVRYLYDYN